MIENREEAMKKVQRSIIFVIGILLWVMQGQSVFAAGSTELLSGTIANTTISYRLTEDGTLTIYSDNIEEMPNYTVNSTVPWAAQKDKIKKVQINSYLKNIGDYAFYGCDSLESVVIQDSKLTEIGIAAFKNCKNLKTINIPETVKAIGTMGFANCNSLQSTKKNPIVIPKGNTEIMDFAFAGCKSMQYIKIPASVEMIGNCAFFECDFLSEIEIEEGQLQEIGDYAFTDCEMESIVIPTKTGKIGEYAFSDCKRLEKIWFLYANGTDTQDIADNMLQGSSHVNALYVYSGKSYESWAKNNGLSDKITYIHNMSGDNSNYKVYLGGVPYGQYSAVYNGQQIKPAVKLYYSGKEVSAADYSVAYSNNVNAGDQATVQIVGKNAYYGKMSLKFTIKQYSLTSNCKISDVQNQSYTGYAITPKISVMCGNRTLKENTDYTVEYSNNKEAGDQKAVITVKGKGNYTGVLQKKFSIVKKSIAGAKIQIHDKGIYKKGKKVKPRVTVTYRNQTLQAGRDYKLSYSNNKKVSKKAVVKIQGIGMYSGTLQKKFTIYPPKANLVVTKKSIKVKNWEKDKGFTILYKYKVDKGKYCKKPVNGNGLAKALKKHKGHKITIKAALKCNGITGAYSQGKKLKLK